MYRHLNLIQGPITDFEPGRLSWLLFQATLLELHFAPRQIACNTLFEITFALSPDPQSSQILLAELTLSGPLEL